jgi:PD-(D/E)XK endonuclease
LPAFLSVNHQLTFRKPKRNREEEIGYTIRRGTSHRLSEMTAESSLRGRILGISEENLDPTYATLHNKHRGELAELAFMRKAASRGYAVSKPWGDCERYDFVVRFRKVFWRVQVKSVRAKYPQRRHYRLNTSNWLKLPYSPEDIDFLVGYIFPEDAWYIFPAVIVENRKVLCITPNSKRSPYEKFREAWKLMEQSTTNQISPEPLKI